MVTPKFNNPAEMPGPYAGFLNDLPVIVYTCDRSGYITEYNKAAIKLWGREPVPGKDRWYGPLKIFNVNGAPMHPDSYPIAKALKEGAGIDGEEIIAGRPDGPYRNLLEYLVPSFNDAGEFDGATNTLIDITDHKSDENKQARLAAIIESSEDAIISKTLKGVITSWNQSAEKLFGYTEQEAIGKNILMLIPPELQDEEQLIIGKISRNERIEHFQTVRLTKTGERIHISLTVSPIRNSKGEVTGASKIVRDISLQKSTEERLKRYTESQEALNAIGQVISAELDIQNILQKVTDATTKLSGAAFGAFFYNEVNESGESYLLYTLSGAPREAFEKFGMPRNTAVFGPTFKGTAIVRVDDITKDPRYGHNAPHYGMPKGHLPVVSYMALPVTSKSGNVIGGLFFGHPEPGKFTADHEQIVEAIAIQAAIALDKARLYEEIKILNAKKDEFIGLASHELKTPVTSINGYLQIIERSLSPDDRNKNFVTRARKQVGKLSDLISDLLDVSKIQTGKLPFNYSRFNLIALLTEVVEVMQQNNTAYHIELHYDTDGIWMTADQQRIEQVVINLISNAIKYSPGTSKIILRAIETKNGVRVSVQDLGIGIARDQHERIFSRFYRVENLASHMSGLGIGLYICREIIDRHKGKLWVESEPGKGSTFFFELPLN